MLAALVAVAAAWLTLAGGAPASPVDQSVAYHLGPAHDGHIADAGLATPLTQQWSVALTGPISYPLIVNGMVFVTAGDTTLYALSQATGAVLWTRELGGTFSGAGIAYDRGQIFALDDDGALSAFDAATGAPQWSHDFVGSFSAPPTAADGVVYFGAANSGGTLFAVRERDAHELWSQRFLNSGGSSTPAVDAERVYITWWSEDAYAFDRVSGSRVWQLPVPCDAVGGVTPVVAGGSLFARCVGFPQSDGYILSAATGEPQGSISPGPAPAVADGVAFVLAGSTLKAIAGGGRGATLWQFSGDGHLVAAPVVVGGLVVAGSSEGALYALDRATGATSWSTNVGAGLSSSESMSATGLGAANGTLVVPAADRLVAYRSAGAIAAVPANQAAPSIDGEPRADETLAADVGIWSQLPGSYAYQWRLCDGAGASCADIPAATAATYTPASADVGSTLRVRVVATNDVGSSAAVTSSATGVITEAAPVNQMPPAISGAPRQGATLTAGLGTWNGDPASYAIRWRRCELAPSTECVDIPGATATTYALTADDVGSQIVLRVVATNPGGASDPADSAPTTTVLPLPPVNLTPPTFTGNPDEGFSLQANPGTWSGFPSSFSYQWFSCDADGTSCPDIAGATEAFYVVRSADVGRYIGVEVVATNAGGDSEPADSDALGPVYPEPPFPLSPPTIGGELQSGRTLTAGPGGWAGSPTGYFYQWYSCDASLQACRVEPVTATTFTLGSADVGRRMSVGVVAVNDGGESYEVFSDDTGPVRPAPIIAPPPPVVVAPVPDPRFTLLSARVRADGSLAIKLRMRNPGRFSAVATASAASLATRRACGARCPTLRGTAVYGKGALRVAKAGSVTVVVRPSARAKRALKTNRALRVRVKVSFTSALGGRASTRSRSLTVPGTKRRHARR